MTHIIPFVHLSLSQGNKKVASRQTLQRLRAVDGLGFSTTFDSSFAKDSILLTGATQRDGILRLQRSRQKHLP